MEVNIKLTIEDGEVVKAEVIKPEVLPTVSYSQYARFFDESCKCWTRDSRMNYAYLKHCELHANDILRHTGHLFLNQVYDMLGIGHTKLGAMCGWIYSEDNTIGDNQVDFGLTKESASDFVKGLVNTVLLDFNVDGPIIDRL